MSTFVDAELGDIIVHKRRGTHAIHVKLGTDGRYVATAPPYTPLVFIKQVVRTSRDRLRALACDSSSGTPYQNHQAIGKHHQLATVPTSMVSTPKIVVKQQTLLVYLPPSTALIDTQVQQQVRDAVIRILRKEAKAYLPQHLSYLATQYGFAYQRIRFSHASSRWGSCSSNGTISLNIALMKLPDTLIDYVLIHELSHTRHMDHSPAFWREVARYDPLYKLHRQLIKRETPIV